MFGHVICGGELLLVKKSFKKIKFIIADNDISDYKGSIDVPIKAITSLSNNPKVLKHIKPS